MDVRTDVGQIISPPFLGAKKQKQNGGNGGGGALDRIRY